MGFSSWCCPTCSKSILASYACESDVSQEWCHATAVSADMTASGVYNGYGVLQTSDGGEIAIYELKNLQLYHTACYLNAGKPAHDSKRPSEWARDQGYFIQPEDYQGVPG